MKMNSLLVSSQIICYRYIGGKMIKRVLDEEKANYCDKLLEKLIMDEKKYDSSIMNVHIENYFKEVVKNQDNILLVYEENNIIKGYIFFKKLDKENGYLIDGLYVEEEYRNLGIAKKLLTEGLKLIKNRNIDYIGINVLANNKIAFDLYKSFGFKEFKIIMRKEL